MRLLEWRTAKDLKQGDLAKLLELEVSQISKIERGETFVSPKTGDAIKRITNGAVTLDDLHDQWLEYRAKAGAA
jgi:transcriptional regulator with XRE-family HTH domain